MSFLRLFLLPVVLAVSVAAQSRGGLIVESTDKAGEEAPVASRLYLDTNGLRADSPENAIIFRADKKVLWVIDASHKEYSQMTESDLTNLSARMDDAMKQMNERLAQLPPEQRTMVEEMMKKQMPGGMPGTESASPVKTTFEKVGSGEKTGEWTADKYVEKENGKKVGEVWTVPASTFSGFAQYFKMLRNLGAFFSKLPGTQGKAMEFPIMKASNSEVESGLSGIPVKDVRFHADGTTASQWELKKISEEAVDATLLEIPAGYKQRSLMEESN